MRKILLVLGLVVVLVVGGIYFIWQFGGFDMGIRNPASVYCEELGYKIRMETSESGGQRGICVIEEGVIEFGEWDFFIGKVGKEYSYCAETGYDLEVDEDSKEYSFSPVVCVSKETGERIFMEDLMNLGEKL